MGKQAPFHRRTIRVQKSGVRGVAFNSARQVGIMMLSRAAKDESTRVAQKQQQMKEKKKPKMDDLLKARDFTGAVTLLKVRPSRAVPRLVANASSSSNATLIWNGNPKCYRG